MSNPLFPKDSVPSVLGSPSPCAKPLCTEVTHSKYCSGHRSISPDFGGSRTECAATGCSGAARYCAEHSESGSSDGFLESFGPGAESDGRDLCCDGDGVPSGVDFTTCPCAVPELVIIKEALGEHLHQLVACEDCGHRFTTVIGNTEDEDDE